MLTMSLIACRMFEDEIVHLVGNDPHISDLIVVANDECQGLVNKLNMVGYKQVAKVDTGLSYETEFNEKVDEFASTFDFDVLDIKANLGSIEQCYMGFRDELLGADHMQ
ncbi:MAG: DUF1638 domain-containing protein [Euryarchaeota archaeon]|nr:DUF1638 domain-containing protein [Euryarchaeota archaeon]